MDLMERQGMEELRQSSWWVLVTIPTSQCWGPSRINGILISWHCFPILLPCGRYQKQARIIERKLRRRIWKHEVFIDFLIDYIICDCIIIFDCIFDYIICDCKIIFNCIFDYNICDCIFYQFICDCIFDYNWQNNFTMFCTFS